MGVIFVLFIVLVLFAILYYAIIGGVQESDLAKIDKMDGHQFEYWCAELLKKTGYQNVQVTRGSGDQGVDIVAVKDGVRLAFQCKRYSKNVGNKPVQEVYAGMAVYDCPIGVVITNQYFTKGAIELAEKTEVVLIDRNGLKAMIAEVNKKQSRAARKQTSTKKMWPYVDATEIDIPYFKDRPDIARPKDMADYTRMYPVDHENPHDLPPETIVTIISDPFLKMDHAEWFAGYLTKHCCAVCNLEQVGFKYKIRARAHVFSIQASYWDRARDYNRLGGFYEF